MPSWLNMCDVAGFAGAQAVKTVEDDEGTSSRDDELRDEHPNRPRDHDSKQLVYVGLLKAARRNDVKSRLFLSHLLCAMGEQDRSKRLRQPYDRTEGADPECSSPLGESG
ncbi:hypothetical protein E4U55_004764 [Claviceps digitariae]|nr:hypothetical protein E4U55_004764 [Claviceps digitariae]